MIKKRNNTFGNVSNAPFAKAKGYATETHNFGETAFGILNKSTVGDVDTFATSKVVDSSKATLFSVGNGTKDQRKNIIELKANGDVYINGIGGYDGTNSEDATSMSGFSQIISGDIDEINKDIENVVSDIEGLSSKVDSISIQKGDSDLQYTLVVDGVEKGTINIPKDQFLKNVEYDEDSNNLIFTFVTTDDDNKVITINLNDLVDIYNAGDGLQLSNGKFSIKLDPSTESYLTVSENGLKLSGIDEKLTEYLPLNGGNMTGNITFESAPDSNEHEYVDLGLPSGNLWAKCNIGANTEEEVGLYFQWGDTQGYTAEQVGHGEGLKAFKWVDYKFSIDGSSIDFSKYNASDSKNVLDPEDDAAHVNMSGSWRMPTFEEFKELCLNTDIYLVPTEGEEIQGTAEELSGGVTIAWASQAEGTLNGVKFYKKGDKQTYMFVPADGVVGEGYMQDVGQVGALWSSSLGSPGVHRAWRFHFSVRGGGVSYGFRYHGYPVRGVLSNNIENSKGIIIEGKTESDLLNAAGGTVTVQSILDQVPEPDLSPLQDAIGDNTYEGSNYLTKETNLTDAVVQLDEEIKATNDNLALEHANAEAIYAKKTDLSSYLTKTDASSTYQVKGNYLTSVSWDQVNDKPAFSTVATSGSYSDLTNTPEFKTIGGETILGSGNFDIATESDITALFN